MPDTSISDLPLDERSRTEILTPTRSRSSPNCTAGSTHAGWSCSPPAASAGRDPPAEARLPPRDQRVREDSLLAGRPAAPRLRRPPGRDHRADRPQARHQRAELRRQGVHGRLRGRQLADLGEPDLRPRQPGRRDRGTIAYEASDGRHYELGEEPATLLVRPRGLHLPERHIDFDGTLGSGALVDFGLFAFHGAPRLAAGRGAYLYLPKLEHHLEARLWNERASPSPRTPRPRPRHIPRHGPDRDAARRLPDGGDPVRAARALLRNERGPLGLHLLGDQDLPRAPRRRPPRPRRGDDDGALHARLHRAPGPRPATAAAPSRWAGWRR